MATIDDAVREKVLEIYELPHWESRSAIRPLWVACEFWDWADGDRLQAEKVGGRTLYEHLEQMLCEFRCNPRCVVGDLKRVMPTSKGVFKLHPAKLRIFGWAPAVSQFVVVTGALEADTKTNSKLNDAKRNEVLNFIKRHQLQHTIMRGDVSAIFPPL